MSKTIARTLLPVLLIALLAPAAASAKSPPRGKYTCTTYSISMGTGFAGVLRIHKGNKYSVNGGKKGKFKTKGKTMRFKTGDYKGTWIGKWRKSGNDYIISLRFPDEPDVEGLNCPRGK
jgi:hypothetical protein